MIVIFSYSGDKSTNKLIDWLVYYEVNFIRVNLQDEDFRNINVKDVDGKINIVFSLKNNKRIDFSKVSFFYVRGKGFELNEISNNTKLPDFVFYKYMKQEFEALTNFFYTEVNKKSIGCFPTINHLKLQQLLSASELGLKFPRFIIESKKNIVEKTFFNERIITKAIQENIATDYENRLIIQRVQRIEIEKLENSFFPSFFQTEILKDYEIRVFVLMNRCYAIKFYSASESIDMRDNYSLSNYLPYKLPLDIEMKVKKLNKKLGLFSSSIDLIKSTNNEYFFLEVNPNGQYDWVSQFGHYHLDKIIAKKLMKIWKKK